MCMKKLNLVDNTLEKLGTPKEYRKMQNLLRRMLVLWLVVVSVTFTVDALWYIETFNEKKFVIIPFIMDYTLHINTLTDIMFIFLLRLLICFYKQEFLILDTFLIFVILDIKKYNTRSHSQSFNCTITSNADLFQKFLFVQIYKRSRYIGNRFDKINDHIEQLSKNEDCGLRCSWKKSVNVAHLHIGNMKNHRLILWIEIHLHLELCQITRDINDMFGIQMTLQMMSYFVMLTGMIYFQYNLILCRKQIYMSNRISLKLICFSSTWFIIFIMKFISINYICETVSVKAQKIKELFHKLTNLTRFTKAYEEIGQFVLYTSLRPLKLSGMGLFYFGYNFMQKFFVQILTFIIILIQMHTTISKGDIACLDVSSSVT